MDIEDQISFYNVQQKIELIVQILKDLSINNDFHFTFNYALISKHAKKIITIDRLSNNNINVPVLGMFIDELIKYKKDKDEVMDSVASGRLMVMCLDDTAKPEGVTDWPIKNEFYFVESIYTTIDGGNIIRLAGLDPSPYMGYKSCRFVQLFTKFNQN